MSRRQTSHIKQRHLFHMRRNVSRFLPFFARYAVVGLAIAFVVSVFAPWLVDRIRNGFGPEQRVSQGEFRQSPRSLRDISYSEAVNRASPAVVNIYANKVTPYRQTGLVVDDLTRRLLGTIAVGPVLKRTDQNLGSGVIFSDDGYVLTNNHVISGADDIQVMIDDGRVAKARVIGSDIDTDLAVLKIDLDKLPTIPVAELESGRVVVGDVVLAIGNPVGIGKTVTMGIVSATGRQLRLSAYEDFIQTDAAINAGNSGGALVNSMGELVGINTAIYPRTATQDGRGTIVPGADGISFAIPVATAKAVLAQIIDHGEVVRGWIGADYVGAAYAGMLIPVPTNSPMTDDSGVVIAAITPRGPADLAGLQPGDRLLKIDGHSIVDQADMRNREAALRPGETVTLEGERDGNQTLSIKLTVAKRQSSAASSGA
ncbi:MAG: trypsin-like peptidase domain-containing protein [Dokdonella sp.]